MSQMLIEILTAISDIMCDNMLVNVLGLPGHFMPVDLNIEHLIGYRLDEKETRNKKWFQI